MTEKQLRNDLIKLAKAHPGQVREALLPILAFSGDTYRLEGIFRDFESEFKSYRVFIQELNEYLIDIANGADLLTGGNWWETSKVKILDADEFMALWVNTSYFDDDGEEYTPDFDDDGEEYAYGEYASEVLATFVGTVSLEGIFQAGPKNKILNKKSFLKKRKKWLLGGDGPKRMTKVIEKASRDAWGEEKEIVSALNDHSEWLSEIQDKAYNGDTGKERYLECESFKVVSSKAKRQGNQIQIAVTANIKFYQSETYFEG
jgi:hypothetical protein